jgi:hypothetical protein
VIQEYATFKKKRELQIKCYQLSKTLGTTIENKLSGEVDILNEALTFLSKRIESINALTELNDVEEIVRIEEQHVRDIMKRNAQYTRKRLKTEANAKTDWLIQHYLDLGMTKKEAHDHLKKGIELCNDGLNGLIRLEQNMEKKREILDIFHDP